MLVRHETIVGNPLDFRAFYCAGAAALVGDDPYRAEPLRSCEIASGQSTRLVAHRYVAVPAPLPGYALPIFMLAARTDFTSASILFAIATLVAVGISVVTLQRLTKLPIIPIAATLLFMDAYLGLVSGQIVPFIIMLLCLAALACQLDRPWYAALCCAGATIEPHLALPACVSLALFVPRARFPLAVLAVLLSLLSLAVLGIGRNVEYLVEVLPAHVASEATSTGQYSLTALLFHIGVPLGTSIRAGELSYVVMTTLGLAATRALRRTPDGAAYTILVPVTFALFGGPFIHITQVAAALPAGLVLIARCPRYRLPFVVALSFLAVPWFAFGNYSAKAALILATVSISLAVVAPLLVKRAPSLVLSFTLLACALGIITLQMPATPRIPDPVPALMRVAGPQELAETTWTVFQRITQSRETIPIVAAKLPTWIGLLMLLAFALRFATTTRAQRASAGQSELTALMAPPPVSSPALLQPLGRST